MSDQAPIKLGWWWCTVGQPSLPDLFEVIETPGGPALDIPRQLIPLPSDRVGLIVHDSDETFTVLPAEVGERATMEIIEGLANEACGLAKDNPDLEDDGVNWGDFRCIDVERVASLFADPFYRVILSEASPDAWKVRSFVANFLQEHGHHGVDVVTEW